MLVCAYIRFPYASLVHYLHSVATMLSHTYRLCKVRLICSQVLPRPYIYTKATLASSRCRQ